MKRSGKFGPPAKMSLTKTIGYENDKATTSDETKDPPEFGN